jgi:hypothetical protein
LHHAQIIEQQKQTETEIIDSILELIDFPTSPTADPQRPSVADALRFQECMIPFQPNDYDDLIEERNINDKCGYVLCPRPKKKAPSRALKQFIETSNGVEIVDRKRLEVWCSEDCARRALYVKVQLNEEPAWLRQGGVVAPIELLVENAEEHRLELPLRPKESEKPPADSDADEVASAWAALDDARLNLAMERGEKADGPSKTNESLITPTIKENVGSAPPVAPSQDVTDSHMAIEGHVPRATGIRKEKEGDDEDEEDDPQDWDKHLPG